MQEADWAVHLRAAIPDALKTSHGWTRAFELGGRKDQRLVFHAGGLTVPYQCGVIELDLTARTLVLRGIDQKTPWEEQWCVTPTDDWWTEAAALEWPD